MDAALQQQQQMWGQPPPQSAFTSTSAGDSDLWATTAELLAFIDDPEVTECHGDTTPEPEDASGAVIADLSMSGSLSEDDFELIARSTDGRTPDSSVVAASRVDGAARSASFDTMNASLPAAASESAAGRRHTTDQTVRSTAKIKATASSSTALTVPMTRKNSADEARRERNRLKVRRLYYRKLDRMNALRSQVADLEENLERLRLAQTSSMDTTDSSELSAITTQPSKPNVDYAVLLDQLISSKQRLQHENESLRRIISQHVKSVHAISVSLMQQRESPTTAYLKIKSVTRQECAELRRRTLKHVHNFARNRSLFTDAGSVCGWQSRQLTKDGVHQFSIEKTLPRPSATIIAQMVWSVLSEPDQFVRLYSRAVGLKCYLLQTIDADNVVIFQEFRTMIPLEERRALLRTILLVSRVRSESGGFLITITSLDRDSWVLDDPSTSFEECQGTMIVWSELSCWMEYQDTPSSSDSARLFAGFVPIVGSNVSFWMLEMMQLAVRCENMTVGPASYSLLSPIAPSEDEGGETTQ